MNHGAAHTTAAGPAPAGARGSAELLVGLNARQREAVTHTGSPLLVLAGAGSGKTRVLVSRIERLIVTGTDPARIMVLTFTNKAAGEIRSRLSHTVGTGAARAVTAGTFHSICARVLRRHPLETRRTNRFTIFDSDDTRRSLRRLMGAQQQGQVSVDEVADRVSRAKNNLVDVGEYTAWARDDTEALVAHVWGAYERELADSDARDFDDLLIGVVRLFDEDQRLRDQYRRRYLQVLVDEYQDTNPAQFRFLRLLTEGHRGLTAVGDDDQAIYAFRGADIRNIFEFERRFPDAHVVTLEQNYRSTPQVLDAANTVISKNPNRRPKRLFTDAAPGKPVAVRRFDTSAQEAAWITSRIQQELAAGRTPEQIAVLYRSRVARREVEAGLVRAVVSYQVMGGVGFYQLQSVKDALAYLRLLVNPNDREAFNRAIQAPKRGVGQAAAILVAHATEQGLDLVSACLGADHLPINAPARKALVEFGEQMTTLRGHREDLPASALLAAVVKLPDGLAARLTEKQERDSDAARDLGRLRDLYRNLLEWERGEPDATTQDWLEAATLASGDGSERPGGAVTLSTIHAAKGLEWPVVFVCGVEGGVFPSAHAETSADQQEERRLAYVALTRARETLAVTGAAQRHGKPRTTSPYISELNRQTQPAPSAPPTG